MTLIITFAIGLLTGSFITIFAVAATNINGIEEDHYEDKT